MRVHQNIVWEVPADTPPDAIHELVMGEFRDYDSQRNVTMIETIITEEKK